MSARDDIMADYEELRGETCVSAKCVAACESYANRKLDAYRAEVLREAATAVVVAVYDGPTIAGIEENDPVRYAAAVLRRMADPTGETE